MIRKDDTDILCVSETWLVPALPDNFIGIPGYNVFRCDKNRGGGTCIYIKEDLKVTKINLDIDKVEGIEDVWLSIQCRKLPSIIIGSIYRHPKAPSHTFDYLLEAFRLVLLKNKSTLILGDLNDDLLTPNSRLNRIIKTTKLHQMIDKPTRITPQSSTLIDVVITDKPENIVNYDVSPCEIADHERISVEVDISKPKHKNEVRTYRSLRNYSPNIFCDLILEQIPILNKILETDDVDSQLNVLNEVFNSSLSNCAPIITKEIRRPFAPWVTEDIQLSIKKRDDIKKRLKKDRQNPIIHAEYKREKKLVKSKMYNVKTNYNKAEINKCKGKSKETWKVLNNIIPNKNRPTKYTFDDVDKKAEEFNEFFANVGQKMYERAQEKLNEENPVILGNASPNVAENVSLFRPQPVAVETVILKVKELNDSNAFGNDGFASRFIKDSIYSIAFYLTIVVNTSIVTGQYPNIWKYSQVVPYHKKGDKDDINNYRPVSLLPVISKVLEKVVADQLMGYLESNHLLSNSQHGFRKTLSTETALTKITEKLYDNMDNKSVSLMTLCDLSKAFDSVNHEVLIRKCRDLKINSFWFENYLENRNPVSSH